MDKNKLLTYISSLDLMSLATFDEEPHIAIVYYGIDANFNFYIVTSPSSIHGEHINKNSSVACAIVNSAQRQFRTKKKVGVQINGEASEIINTDKMKYALEIWSKGDSEIVNTYLKNISTNTWQSRPYIIKPKKIKWFNENLYGEEGAKIFTF